MSSIGVRSCKKSLLFKPAIQLFWNSDRVPRFSLAALGGNGTICMILRSSTMAAHSTVFVLLVSS